MKKLIKILSVFMVLAMPVSAFAACSDKGSTGDTETSDTQPDTTNSVTPPSEDDEDVIKILYKKGAKI